MARPEEAFGAIAHVRIANAKAFEKPCGQFAEHEESEREGNRGEEREKEKCGPALGGRMAEGEESSREEGKQEVEKSEGEEFEGIDEEAIAAESGSDLCGGNAMFGGSGSEEVVAAGVAMSDVVLAGDVVGRAKAVVDIGIADGEVLGEFGVGAEMPGGGRVAGRFGGPAAIGIAAIAAETAGEEERKEQEEGRESGAATGDTHGGMVARRGRAKREMW